MKLLCGSLIVLMFMVTGCEISDCEKLTKEKKYKQAFAVCLKDAKKGDAYAQNIVGVSYMAGEGVAINQKTAVYWYRKSATQGFAKAQSNMGLSYLMGRSVPNDIELAIFWWQKAAAQGEPHAAHNLLVAYGETGRCKKE